MFGVDDIIGGAIGIGESVVGLINKGKADKEAKQLQATRPKLADSPYLKDQLSLSESNLSTGMSAEAKTAYEQDLDKTLSTSLSTLLKGGGSVNNISEILAGDQQGRARLSMMKDNLRLAEIDRLTRAQDAQEEFRQKQFEFNQWQPWADAAQANAQARQGAESEIWGGLGLAGSSVMKGVERGRAQTDYNSYLNPASNSNKIGTASTNTISPASNYSTLDPNSYSHSLVDELLANPNG